MWLLSGALFPVQGVPTWLGWVVRLDPLTYGLTLLRSVLYPAGHVPEVGLTTPIWISWLVSLGFLIAMFAFALQVARKRDESR